MQLKRATNRMETTAFDFPSALSQPKHVLVCLPRGLRELTLVKQFLPNLSDLFKPADITLLSAPGIRIADIYPRKGFQILTPSSEQLSWSGLPKKSFIKSLHEHKFDAVIDLNLQASPFVSWVLVNLPDALRIGRGNHLGQPYYNLEIKTRYLRDERNIYRSLIETLELLKGAQRNNSRTS
jgi:hypothetical protein